MRTWWGTHCKNCLTMVGTRICPFLNSVGLVWVLLKNPDPVDLSSILVQAMSGGRHRTYVKSTFLVLLGWHLCSLHLLKLQVESKLLVHSVFKTLSADVLHLLSDFLSYLVRLEDCHEILESKWEVVLVSFLALSFASIWLRSLVRAALLRLLLLLLESFDEFLHEACIGT